MSVYLCTASNTNTIGLFHGRPKSYISLPFSLHVLQLVCLFISMKDLPYCHDLIALTHCLLYLFSFHILHHHQHLSLYSHMYNLLPFRMTRTPRCVIFQSRLDYEEERLLTEQQKRAADRHTHPRALLLPVDPSFELVWLSLQARTISFVSYSQWYTTNWCLFVHDLGSCTSLYLTFPICVHHKGTPNVGE